MNKIFISGHLAKAPKIRYTQSGKAVMRTSIAVRRPFSKDKDATDFFNIEAWEKTAEFFDRYLAKGSKVLIEGRLQNNVYEKDGVKHYAEKIIVENVEFAGGKSEKKSDEPKGEFDGEPVNDDDMPF